VASASTFELERQGQALHVGGELRIGDAAPFWRALTVAVKDERSGKLDIDLSGAKFVDGAIMSLFVELRAELARRGVSSEIIGARPQVEPVVKLYEAKDESGAAKGAPRVPLVERVGRGMGALLDGARRFVLFTGELSYSGFAVLRRPRKMDLARIPVLAQQAGASGVPIVLLLNFLVGVIMAYQSSKALRIYGANVYVADLVGISVTRELCPLMTAIILSGRSGAAFAAELGTMTVEEELDALRTIGLSPQRWLVLPRVAALVLVAPVLTLLADVVAVVGGGAVAALSLSIGPRVYLSELRASVLPSDVWTGLVKSVVFGAAIAFIGCQQGFATTGGASGVGRRTTSTVVTCLLAIVVIDTAMTVIFRVFGR
jgi:phospholipid/cholesterol/gamma-HCH transport system permease protein